MREMGKMLSCLVRKLLKKLFKITGDGSAVVGDFAPETGVSSLVARVPHRWSVLAIR